MASIRDRLVRDRRALVATVNETMAALKIGRAKTYELLNARELESYLEGSSRKVTWRSIEAYIERRLEEEANRRNHRGRGKDNGNTPM
ncbi:DNA-binding protein [Bradyrhizobium sp. RDM4]|uniref:DNA-binding protein n=1 Tax=Bradyrhizobium sp. RDM4 TaxID=3378765 RepID=UPI0038FCF4AA